MSLVDAGDLAVLLGKTWTQEQTDAVQADLDAAQAQLENYLNRWLERKTRTVTLSASWDGGINLRGPVVSVDLVTLEGDPTARTWRWDVQTRDRIVIDDFNRRDTNTSTPPFQNSFDVTYTAGDQTAHPDCVKLIKNVVVSQQLVGLGIASGAFAGINVEGTSIQLGARMTGNMGAEGWGPYALTDLKPIGRLRRRVAV